MIIVRIMLEYININKAKIRLTLRQEVFSVCVIGKRGGDSTTPLSFS